MMLSLTVAGEQRNAEDGEPAERQPRDLHGAAQAPKQHYPSRSRPCRMNRHRRHEGLEEAVGGGRSRERPTDGRPAPIM